MSKTETKKQYWQRIAKSMNIKFQGNDTISMLVASIAAKLKIDADGISPSYLQKMVSTKLAEPIEIKENAKGKAWSKGGGNMKGSVKVKVKKSEEPTNILELPDFKNVADMKIFCVHTGLNLLDGYVLASRFKQVAFLEWIKEHAAQATNIDTFVFPSSLKTDSISEAKKLVPGFDPSLETHVVDADVSSAMKDYANCLQNFILKAPSVEIHGRLPQGELDDMIAKALKSYTYGVESDEFGKFINMKNEKGAVIRIPESGYLPL